MRLRRMQLLHLQLRHLCLCALAVLTQQHERPCSDARAIVLLIVDLLWSVFASAEVVNNTTLTRAHLPLHVKLVAGCMFASAHVIFNCAALGLLEMLSRGALYYVLCSLVILCKPFYPVDRGADSALHLCAPVLLLCAAAHPGRPRPIASSCSSSVAS